MKRILFFCLLGLLFLGCKNKDKEGDEVALKGEGGLFVDGSENAGGNSEFAGRVTAGEWRDADNWLFWSELMTETKYGQEGVNYTTYSDYWGLYTNNRVAVRVKSAGDVPQQDVRVTLVYNAGSGDQTLFEGRTDNKGEVNLWIGLTQRTDNASSTGLKLLLNGVACDGTVKVTHWGEAVQWNDLTGETTRGKAIDIAFIVDATGSMMDEIDFLKADLTSIISSVSGKHSDVAIRTAALFYRDEGDEYVTRVSDFASSISTTTSFIAKQTADGGGDYPEAVHTALEKGLQSLSWREDNGVRLAFMLLDAPPHKQDNVIKSLQASVPQYAKRGVRIIPVAASGVDKPTEFFLRFVALATDGTYVFLTNDSGVGGEHITPTVGEYKVELLSDLIVRLIDEYLK